MKVLPVLLIIFLCIAGISVKGQRITFKKKNITLQRVFKEIRKQTKYDFLYNSNLLKGTKSVNVNFNNSRLEEALDSLFKNNLLEYTIEDKVVMITAKEVFIQLKPMAYSISGVIKDKKGLTLPGANILLSGYQIGTIADSAGRFQLKGLTAGNYNLLVDMMGYTPSTQNVIITNKAREVEVLLEETVRELTEVVIRPDPFRSEYLATFKENFIGTSVNAKKCTILNPEVIRFTYDTDQKILKASSDELLIIENKALGYTLKYLLNFFEKDYETNVVHFNGYPYFEELKDKPSKIKKYSKVRRSAYIGSPQHFLRTLYNDTYQKEGFFINRLVKAPNLKKKSESIIDERLKLLSEKTRKRKDERRRKESLIYWTQMKLLPDTVEVLLREEVQRHTFVQQKAPSIKMLDFKDALYVIFIKEREPKDYTKYSGYKIPRPADFIDFQVSLMYQLKPSPSFYENGALFDPESLLFEGIWAYEKIADMMPMDYVLEKTE
ncbi:MAG: carboxypeptidase-like regulatory domain-containing protein [Pedobacter sp.]|nr:MAG: carboxypeptidase-like regulatory domain-containing protein [Pedobacter sp.]